MRTHIGPYQRPAPPKKPLRLGAPRAVQQPAVPMHEIEAQAQVVLQGMIEKVRKPGRPSVHEEPMTPAQRQARRRASQSQQRAIRETLQVGDAHGKSHGEAKSGGYDSQKLDTMHGLRACEGTDGDDGVIRGGARHVRAADGESSAAHEQTTEEILNSGESSSHRGGFEERTVERIRVRGIRIGDEESNRQRFAEGELRKMVEEHFSSPEKAPSAFWIAKRIGNNAVQHHVRPAITLTCKLCVDSMQSIEDAQDHLLVDHRGLICEWFEHLNPPREFRDMGFYVTVAMPRRRKSVQNHAISTAK